MNEITTTTLVSNQVVGNTSNWRHFMTITQLHHTFVIAGLLVGLIPYIVALIQVVHDTKVLLSDGMYTLGHTDHGLAHRVTPAPSAAASVVAAVHHLGVLPTTAALQRSNSRLRRVIETQHLIV